MVYIVLVLSPKLWQILNSDNLPNRTGEIMTGCWSSEGFLDNIYGTLYQYSGCCFAFLFNTVGSLSCERWLSMFVHTIINVNCDKTKQDCKLYEDAPYLLVRNVCVSCVRYTKMVGLIFCYINHSFRTKFCVIFVAWIFLKFQNKNNGFVQSAAMFINPHNALFLTREVQKKTHLNLHKCFLTLESGV